MDPAFLSQHSSNPLEAPSDDPRNRRYVRQYRRASQRARIARDEQHSSSDEVLDAPEVEQYQNHIAQLYQGQSLSQTKTEPDTSMEASISTRPLSRAPPGYIDLDEDMSDEEGVDVPLDSQPPNAGKRGQDRHEDDTLVGGEEGDEEQGSRHDE